MQKHVDFCESPGAAVLLLSKQPTALTARLSSREGAAGQQQGARTTAWIANAFPSFGPEDCSDQQGNLGRGEELGTPLTSDGCGLADECFAGKAGRFGTCAASKVERWPSEAAQQISDEVLPLLGFAQQRGVETDAVKSVLQQWLLLLQVGQCPVNTLPDIGHVLCVEELFKRRQRSGIRVERNRMASFDGMVRRVLQHQQCQEVVTDLTNIGHATNRIEGSARVR